jgi:hypothetical protein
MLALARARAYSNEPRPGNAGSRRSILEALEYALATDRWNICNPEQARFLKIENLIALRAYAEALSELGRVRKSPREAELTLRILSLSNHGEFRRYLTETLDRYPREPGPVRVFLGFLKAMDKAGLNPQREDLALLELAVRRLPALLLNDADLAWMAAPFMRDTAEAKRLVSAYRAIHEPAPASLPAALKLGVIDDETALEELFAAAGSKVLRLDILEEVWGLLRRQGARAVFRRNLSIYSGVILEDADRDGIPDAFAEYRVGVLVSAGYNRAQDGVPDLTVFFEAGDPRRAVSLLPLENSGAGRKEARVTWEQYPAILEVELDGAKYISRLMGLNFQPFNFIELWGSEAYFPRLDPLNPPLTRRTLVSEALRVERPSAEFYGGIEVVELNQGIPVRAREYVNGLMVSETEFLRGRPQLQRVDLNFDGKMDTVRHFRREYRAVELEELWNYDRNIDYTVSDWDEL